MADSVTTSGGLPLHEILKAPLSPHELEFQVRESDIKFLADFEEAWSRFLHDNPGLIPRGIREKKIQELQEKVKQEQETLEKVKREFDHQIQFFEESCEKLEEMYTSRMQAAIEKQKESHEELEKRLDDVAIADHIQQQTLQWHHFVHELDQAAALGEETDSLAESVRTSRGQAGPSSRAIVLTDLSKGSANDILLRAYRMDHALLTTHIKMLSKEIERYQRMVRAQDMTGKFLRDNNAWSILTKVGSDSSTEGGTTHTGSRSRYVA